MYGSRFNCVIFRGKYVHKVLRVVRLSKNAGNCQFFASGFGGAGSEKSVDILFKDNKHLRIESGKLAKLADGCATVTENETTIMATVVSKPTGSSASFVPLTVSYRQKAAALGRIPLNFLRRELGQSEAEILTSRMIDRSVRPLFPRGFDWETQVVCNPLALDGSTFPDVLAINAASAALAVSDVPWEGPVGAVRVTAKEGEIVVNPNKKELTDESLNLIVAARTNKLVVMLEGCSNNILLPDLLKAIKTGVKHCQVIASEINKLRDWVGKEKREFLQKGVNPELLARIKELSNEKLTQIFLNSEHHKLSRDEAVSAVQENVIEAVSKEFSSEDCSMVRVAFQDVCKDVFRECIFNNKIRCDGRSLDELRPIDCQVGLFKPLHGSALFQRGQTQVMCTVSLDSPESALKIDRITMLTSGLKEKNFFVHYEFPPYATKEIGRMGPVGRREIGHGALAEKALKANVPRNFPFAIRLTSEVLESNGSSSMATVCGGSLALWDAGVPAEKACAGVAMGILTRPSPEDPNEIGDYVILTDILGIEDYFGEMDFKVAFTSKELTAIQMDLKNQGLPLKILSEILAQAKTATSKILNIMAKACKEPRVEGQLNWPVIEKVNVPLHLRSKFLGPGGMNVKKMESEVGVDITEVSPGEFSIFAPNSKSMEEAKVVVENILKDAVEIELEFGGIYSATVVEIKNHGCMVSIHPSLPPVLVHVSQLDQRKVNHPSVLGLEVGQRIEVKYFGRDPVSGLIRLSRKVLQGPPSEVIHSFSKPDQEETASSESKDAGRQ